MGRISFRGGGEGGGGGSYEPCVCHVFVLTKWQSKVHIATPSPFFSLHEPRIAKQSLFMMVSMLKECLIMDFGMGHIPEIPCDRQRKNST